MAVKPSYSYLMQTDAYMAFRGELIRVIRWLESKRERALSTNGAPLSSYWDIRSSWLLSRHRSLLAQLEQYVISAESKDRSSFLAQKRREYRRLWKSVPDSPSCPVAKNERERTVLAFGYDPGADLGKTKRFFRRENETISPKQQWKRDRLADFIEDRKRAHGVQRQNQFRHRIVTDMIGREDWFLVFNTLTVNDAEYENVWGDRERHSNIWKKYIARITYDVGVALGLKKGEYRASDIHRYAAVVESGKKKGRLHIHVVHYLKALPNGVVDPNRGRSVPNYQEISAFHQYWEYGFSTPRAVRFGANDPYGNLGWRWPVVRSKRSSTVWVPLRNGSPAVVAAYLGKYLSKDASGINEAEESKRWHYRVKITQGFGLDPYRELMSQLSLGELRKVCMQPLIVPFLKVQGWSPPMSLVIREATREWMKRVSARAKPSAYSAIFTILPQRNIIQQFSQMLDILIMEPTTLSDEVNTGVLLTEILRTPAISDVDYFRGQYMAKRVQEKIDRVFGDPVKLDLIRTGPTDII